MSNSTIIELIFWVAANCSCIYPNTVCMRPSKYVVNTLKLLLLLLLILSLKAHRSSLVHQPKVEPAIRFAWLATGLNRSDFAASHHLDRSLLIHRSRSLSPRHCSSSPLSPSSTSSTLCSHNSYLWAISNHPSRASITYCRDRAAWAWPIPNLNYNWSQPCTKIRLASLRARTKHSFILKQHSSILHRKKNHLF